jgi:hypothetical protein
MSPGLYSRLSAFRLFIIGYPLAPNELFRAELTAHSDQQTDCFSGLQRDIFLDHPLPFPLRFQNIFNRVARRAVAASV